MDPLAEGGAVRVAHPRGPPVQVGTGGAARLHLDAGEDGEAFGRVVRHPIHDGRHRDVPERAVGALPQHGQRQVEELDELFAGEAARRALDPRGDAGDVGIVFLHRGLTLPASTKREGRQVEQQGHAAGPPAHRGPRG